MAPFPAVPPRASPAPLAAPAPAPSPAPSPPQGRPTPGRATPAFDPFSALPPRHGAAATPAPVRPPATPPPPDEIVIDNDFDFTVEAPAPPAPTARAPLAPPAGVGAAKPQAQAGLSGIFDDVPVDVPDLDELDAIDPESWSPSDSLGADLVAAFNAADSEIGSAAAGSALAARLRGLAERLRLEGHHDDADAVTEAIAMLNLI